MIVGSKAIDHAMSNGVVELEAGEAGYPVLSKESSNLSSVGGQIINTAIDIFKDLLGLVIAV